MHTDKDAHCPCDAVWVLITCGSRVTLAGGWGFCHGAWRQQTAPAADLCTCRLLGTFGGENQPCCGFGFGDAVIVELLKERNKLPEFKHQVRSGTM